jgi:hypothetical protein
MNGGDDETRTRDLCRDRRYFRRRRTQNQEVGRVVVGARWLHWAGLAWFCSTVCSTELAGFTRRTDSMFRRYAIVNEEQKREALAKTQQYLVASANRKVVAIG